jgi:hypothetical protein
MPRSAALGMASYNTSLFGTHIRIRYPYFARRRTANLFWLWRCDELDA